MNNEQHSLGFVAIALTVMLLYDVLAHWLNWITISNYMYEVCRQHPIISFTIGLLIGHWLFPVR